MNGLHRRLSLAALVAVALGGVCLAEDVVDEKPADMRQAKLLERFGDAGIDANCDGTLSRDEILNFFADCEGARLGRGPGRGSHGPRFDDAQGMGRHRKGMGPGGPPHQGRGRRGRSLLHRLEVLGSDTPPEGFPLDRFPEADLDGDGVLSDSEWSQFADQRRSALLKRLAKRFPQADANEDGMLDDGELAALKAEHLARQSARILERHPEADTDGDGVVSVEEHDALREQRRAERQARILERYPEADTDGDGTLSMSEMSALREARRAERTERILERHPEADSDGNGVLSREEFRSFRESRMPPGSPRHRRGR